MLATYGPTAMPVSVGWWRWDVAGGASPRCRPCSSRRSYECAEHTTPVGSSCKALSGLLTKMPPAPLLSLPESSRSRAAA